MILFHKMYFKFKIPVADGTSVRSTNVLFSFKFCVLSLSSNVAGVILSLQDVDCVTLVASVIRLLNIYSKN